MNIYNYFFGGEFKPYVLSPEAEKTHIAQWLYSHLVNNVRDHIEVVG